MLDVADGTKSLKDFKVRNLGAPVSYIDADGKEAQCVNRTSKNGQ